ncbi:MAG: hypothetical protein ACRDNK_12805 [Solirubrobacteraceae bacterium]
MARVPLPDGGVKITYATAPTSEGQVGVLSPPQSFDPLTASPAELALYGVPPEPPATNPDSLKNWLQMVHNMHWIQAPPALHDAPGTHFGQIGTNTQGIWAGYYTQEGTGYFHYTSATYIEPPFHSSRCDPNDAVGYWTGIGGVGNGELGQQGTAQGQVDNLGQDQGWIETNLGTVYGTNISATVNYNFYIATSYTNGQYNYFFYNYYNGASTTYYTVTSQFSGATTDYIAERPTANLKNFATMQFTNVTAASQQYPISHYPYVEAIMVNPADNNLLAQPNGVNGAGDAFSVTQHTCN